MKITNAQTTTFNIHADMFNKWVLKDLYDYSHRHVCCKGSAGSGKSVGMSQRLIIKAINDKRKVLVIRKEGSTHETSTYKTFLEVLESFHIFEKSKENPNGYECKTNPYCYIKLPYKGSEFIFRGMKDDNDESKIRSINGITDIFIEEADAVAYEGIKQLNIRLRGNAKNKEIYYLFNPDTKNSYVYNHFRFNESFENETVKKREYDNVVVYNSTCEDNKFNTQEYIDELKSFEHIDYDTYKRFYLGLFTTKGKTIYNNWKVEKLDIDELLKQNLKTLAGLDFGFNHAYTCCISLYDKKNKIIYVIAEMYKHSITNKDAYDWICNNGYSKCTFVCDSASPRDIEELRRLGLKVKPAKKGHNSIRNGIQKIQKYKIVIDENCTNFVNEISNYTWKSDKLGNVTDEVNKINDDLMDSFRYSCDDLESTHATLIKTKFF